MNSKLTLGLVAALFLSGCSQNATPENSETNLQTASIAMQTETNTSKSFYDFVLTDINGASFSTADLKGKRVLIVNTASRCGYTPQYAQLEELYKEHGGDNFTIIGFPANNFGGQEPGTDEEIKAFCQKNYGVSFPMMSKISVTGKDQHPFYTWLTTKKLNGEMDAEVKWNFHKFLIDENGKLVASYPSKVSPLDDEILEFVQ